MHNSLWLFVRNYISVARFLCEHKASSRFTYKFPLSVAAVRIQSHRRWHSGEIEFSAFESFRLVDQFTVLLVEREPRDVDRTVTYGQLKFAIPHALAGEDNLYFALATAR